MKDPAYLSLVHDLPCCVCEAYGEIQMSATQAHHTFHGRFSGRKTPDRQAIPLCEGHHQGLQDTSKLAIHNNKKTWAVKYGFDHEFIAATQDKIERMEND